LTLRFQVDSGETRLDRYLQQELDGYSRSRIQSWIKQGRVLVDGQPAKASYCPRGGETIEVSPSEPPPLKAFPESIPLDVLYEDQDLIAVNKAAGMVVHSGAGAHSGTLVNALLHHFRNLSGVGGQLRPGIVHRLDQYTSGVILVARTDAAHRALSAQFSSRRVEKVYLTLVHGRIEQETGRVDRPITRDLRRRTRMTARLEYGRKALTRFRVLRRYEKFTFLEVRIGTGRTHQIRVHLSTIGYPVVGDRLYGAPARAGGQPELGRYFLHAHRIRFRSPSTGEEITIEAPLPEELRDWMAGLGDGDDL